MSSKAWVEAGAAFALLLLLCAPVRGQQGRPEERESKSEISGQVLNAVNKQPLNRARVVLKSVDGRGSPGTVTGEGGRFVFKNIEPGVYRLRADRTGFAGAEYGAVSPSRPGVDLTVAAGQEMRDIQVALTPHGAISGRVIDAEGEAAPHTDVYCFGYAKRSGRRWLPISATTTNDLGEFRIPELLPGAYVLAVVYRPKGVVADGDAATPSAERESFVPTFYPGATDHTGASPIEVGPGMDVRGIELTPQRGRTATVRGRVRYYGDTADAGRTSILLLPRGSSAYLNTKSTTVRGADGSFEITGVIPGSYVLTAYHTVGSTRHSGQVPVEVGPPAVEGVEITLTPGMSLTGQVRFEGEAPSRSGPDALRIMLAPAVMALDYAQTGVQSDGRFKFESMAPDVYTVKLLGMPDDIYVKGIRFGDEELPSSQVPLGTSGSRPLEITLQRGGSFEGVVVDDRDKATSATVVLVPGSKSRRLSDWCKATEADAAGRFTLRGVPPGEYRLIASQDIDPGDCDTTSIAEQFGTAGQTVTVQENSKHTAEVRLTRGKRLSP